MKTARLLCLLLLPLVSADAFGGAWARKEKELLLVPVYYYNRADSYFDRDGHDKSASTAFEKNELNIYSEYGLGGGNTLALQTSFARLYQGQATTGLADVEASFFRELFRGDHHACSLKALVVIPTGYSYNRVPRLGYGHFAAEAGGVCGIGYDGGYAELSAAYRKYDGYPSDQLRFAAYSGLRLRGPLKLLLSAVSNLGIDGYQDEFSAPQNLYNETCFKVFQAGAGLEYALSESMAARAMYEKALAGENTGSGYQFSAGLQMTFQTGGAK